MRGQDTTYNAASGTVTGTASGATTNVDVSRRTYSIGYNLNGGSISGQPTKYYAYQHVGVPNPSRSGYNFTGWSGARMNTLANGGYAQNLYLTANWQAAGVVVGGTTITKNTALGTTVNYTCSGGGTWQLFYIDTGNKFGDGAGSVYLKRKEHYGSYGLEDCYNTSSNKIWTQNPTWHNYQSSIISNNNAKAVAFLTNTSNWSTFCNTTYASYAIGSPSVEMMQASSGVSTYSGCNATGYTLTDTAGGYTTSLKSGMYNNGTSYWLASPSSYYSGDLCSLYARGSSVDYYNVSGSLGVCPVVCLKSKVQ